MKFQVFIAILSLRWTKTTFSLRRVEKKEKVRIILTFLKHVSQPFSWACRLAHLLVVFILASITRQELDTIFTVSPNL